MTDPEKKSTRWRVWAGAAIAVVLLVRGAIRVGTAVFNGQFASTEIASCTMKQGRQITYKRSSLRARIATDCGNFRGSKEVSCTSDASQQITLIAGTTYDLTVRGPRIPLISAPTIVSATVFDEQLVVPEPGLTEVDPNRARCCPKRCGRSTTSSRTSTRYATRSVR